MMTLLDILVLALCTCSVVVSQQPHLDTVLDVSDLEKVLVTLENHGFNESNWYGLGLSLGLYDSRLDTIEAENFKIASHCLASCLADWLQRVDMVDSKGGPTFSSLSAALRFIGETAVADGIERELAIAKWLQEGTVNLRVKRVQMLGPPGSGKTCSQRLLLNEDPPAEDTLTDSTPITCHAVKATRISVDDGHMERVDGNALLSRLACDLKEAVAKQKKAAAKHGELPAMKKHDTKSKDESTNSLKKTGTTESQDPHSSIILNEIVTAIPEAKANLKCHWVYIVDSGGQTAFQELLPLFTRPASLNIIALDLSKGLNEQLDMKYRINKEQFSCDSNFLHTNIKFIKDVLSFGAILQPYNMQQSKKDTATLQYPEYFVLGTHKDNAKVTPEKIAEFNKELLSLTSGSEEKGYRIIPAQQNGDIIYPVNTMLKPGPERQEESKKLYATLFDFSDDDFIDNTSDDTFEMPVRWFAFELTLLKKAGTDSVIEMNDALSIGRSLQMTEDDTKKALQYLHDVTIILYYPQVLPDIVFVDPHPILDILSRLLALTCKIDGRFLHLFTRVRPLDSELDNLRNRGIFTKSLLDKLKDDQKFCKSDFIKLLLHLHIIVEIQDDYFIPSALPSYTGPLPESSDIINPLLIVWQNPVNKEILPVPRGVFSLAVVNLMNFDQPQIYFSIPSQESPEYLKYRDAISFRVYGNSEHIGTMHFIKKHRHIEIHFIGHKDDTKYCPLIRKAVTEAINNSSVAINLNPTHKLAFACSFTKEKCYYIVTNEAEEKVECNLCSKRAIISGKDEYWNWFHVTHQNSEESWSVRKDKIDTFTLQKILKLLRDSYFPNHRWLDLGLELGFSYHELQTIEDDEKGSHRRLQEMLSLWLTRGNATWSKLVTAFSNIKEHETAEIIKARLRVMNSKEEL